MNGFSQMHIRVTFPFLVLFAVVLPTWILFNGPGTALAQAPPDALPESDVRAKDHLLLGIDFYLSDQLEIAIKEFQEARRLWPEYAEAQYNLGVALAKTGNLDGALVAWQKASQLDPSIGPLPYKMPALVAYNYGVSLLQKGQFDQATEEWSRALIIQPDFAEAMYGLGLGYLAQGKTQLAKPYFQQALSLRPKWPEGRYHLGLACYAEGEISEAIRQWEEALRLNPKYAEAYSNLGLGHFTLGNFGTALQNFQKALSFKDELPQAQFNLGLTYVKLGNLEQSVLPLRRTIYLQPHFLPAYQVLGITLAKLGDWAGTIQIIRKALSLDPSLQQAANLWVLLGQAFWNAGHPKDSLMAFQQALEVDPHLAYAQSQVGMILLTLNDWQGAERAFLKTTQLHPSWAQPFINLGNAQYYQGHTSEAIQTFKEAIRRFPENPDAHLRLGVILRIHNQPDQAAPHIEQAAQAGLADAQDLLGAMYLNGSGVTKSLPLAMKWWGQAAFAGHWKESGAHAREQLSRLRRLYFRLPPDGNDRRQIFDGFLAIQQDIRARYEHEVTLREKESVGAWLINHGQVRNGVEVLLQEAMALHPAAHAELEHLYEREISDVLKRHDPRLRNYFMEAAKEGFPPACRFVKTAILLQLADPSGDQVSKEELKTCPS